MRAKQIELLAESDLTASGSSSDGFRVPVMTMAMLAVNISAVSGSSPLMSLWLQGSDDGGDTWYDIPYDIRLETSSAIADVTGTEQKRNVADQENAALQVVAIYKHLPTDYVRPKWIISGTTPVFTTEVKLVGK